MGSRLKNLQAATASHSSDGREITVKQVPRKEPGQLFGLMVK
jgi:hypothetical protein